MKIIDAKDAPPRQRREMAQILLDAFAHFESAWKTKAEASAEVESFFNTSERRALLAAEGEVVLGWIGAVYTHDFGWELHPLVVDPALQRKGIGTALVAALETAARDAGVLTLWLGTDDDFGGTSIFGKDLFPDPLAGLKDLAPTSGHPFTFYRHLGFEVVGVLPDVDGTGKHDILMAKRVV